jgi:hypothetical protein
VRRLNKCLRSTREYTSLQQLGNATYSSRQDVIKSENFSSSCNRSSSLKENEYSQYYMKSTFTCLFKMKNINIYNKPWSANLNYFTKYKLTFFSVFPAIPTFYDKIQYFRLPLTLFLLTHSFHIKSFENFLSNYYNLRITTKIFHTSKHSALTNKCLYRNVLQSRCSIEHVHK